jgi:hypothetical protein
LDGRILEYFEGAFDVVFISLHPFIRPITLSPDLFYPKTYPGKTKIIESCEAVSWKEVLGLGGFKSLDEIDVGLRTRIGGLKEEFQRKDLSDRLDGIEPVLCPSEGGFSPFSENRLLQSLADLGYTSVIVRDQHLDSISTTPIPELLNKKMIPDAGSILTEDDRIYATTHWDSHYSIVCGKTMGVIEELVRATEMEGFYCDSKTEVYWGPRNLTMISS